jgi:hypothetical protein
VTDDHCLVSRGCTAGCRSGGNREAESPSEIPLNGTSTEQASEPSSGLRPWAWALIVAGVAIAFIVLFAVVFVVYRMKRTAHETV